MKITDIMTEEQYNVIDVLDCTTLPSKYYNSINAIYTRGLNKLSYAGFVNMYGTMIVGNYSFNPVQTQKGILLVCSITFTDTELALFYDFKYDKLPDPQETIPGISSAVDIKKILEQSDMAYMHDMRISNAYWEFHIKGWNPNNLPIINLDKIEPELWSDPNFVQDFHYSINKRDDGSYYAITTIWLSCSMSEYLTDMVKEHYPDVDLGSSPNWLKDGLHDDNLGS